MTLAIKSWIDNSTEILGLDVVSVSIVNYQIIYGAGGVHYFCNFVVREHVSVSIFM